MSEPRHSELRHPDRTVASLLDLALGPMDADEAARFLSVTPSRFSNLAPSLPRFRPPGLSYRYARSDLLAWARGKEAGGATAEMTAEAMWNYVEHSGKTEFEKKKDLRRGGKKGRVDRLV